MGAVVAYTLHAAGPVTSNSLHFQIREQLNRSIVEDVIPVSTNSVHQAAELPARRSDAWLGGARSPIATGIDPLMVRSADPLVEAVRSRSTSSRLASFSVPATENATAPAAPLPAVDGAHLPKGSERLTSRVRSIVKKYAPKHKNPAVLAEAIVKECAVQGYDPLFVAAVIKSESTFNASARSHKGAQGLMQIMPATGAWLAKKESMPRGRLTDPGHNLKLGITYLKQLEAQFNGNRVFTLVAYNWGPGHLERASGSGRRIPAESMTYAVNILNDYRRWTAGVI